MMMMMSIWTREETVEAARLAYERRAERLVGHHMPAWEGLSDLQRERLIQVEADHMALVRS
jgi:hypothetical protein